MSKSDDWEQWKEFLDERIEQAKNKGMSDKVIIEVAYQVGEYLAEQVEPKNEQERILAELWNVASEEEQQAIANMMVKLVQR